MSSEQRLRAVEMEDSTELLGRLERQAAESGRLEGRVQILEDALETERDARRRLAATLKRERKAAEALHVRAELAEASSATQAEELERLRQAVVLADQSAQVIRIQLAETQRELALSTRPAWRKLLRRPPAQ